MTCMWLFVAAHEQFVEIFVFALMHIVQTHMNL